MKRARFANVLALASLVLVTGGIRALAAEARGTSDNRPECVRADEWVQLHANELPSTLDALGKFSDAYQKRIFAALKPVAKVAIWREKLQRVSLDTTLTNEQLDLVHEVLGLLEPGLYEGRAKLPDELVERLRVAFPNGQYASIFVHLKPGSDLMPPPCNCERIEDCEVLPTSPTMFCVAGGTCNRTPHGCGTAGTLPCDGRCQLRP